MINPGQPFNVDIFTEHLRPWLLRRPEISLEAKLTYLALEQIKPCGVVEEYSVAIILNDFPKYLGTSREKLERILEELCAFRLLRKVECEEFEKESVLLVTFLWHEWLDEWVSDPSVIVIED